MTQYRYTGTSSHYPNGGEAVLSPGDLVVMDENEISFPDFYEEAPEADFEEAVYVSPSAEEKSAENGNEAGQEGKEEPEGQKVADPPLDPSEYTLDELEEELSDADYSDDELKALEVVEASSQDRGGAKEMISEAR